jgi:kynureninase
MDDLQQYRRLFPISERLAFLDHAGVAPLGSYVAQAVREQSQRLQRLPFDILRPELTDVLIGDLRERGYTIRSNLSPAHRSGIVVVELPDAQVAYAKLMAAGVVGAVRGAGLRFSPHFYNNEADILRVGEVLGNAQGENARTGLSSRATARTVRERC